MGSIYFKEYSQVNVTKYLFIQVNWCIYTYKCACVMYVIMKSIYLL